MQPIMTTTTQLPVRDEFPASLAAYTHGEVVARLVSSEGHTHASAELLFQDLKRFLLLCSTTSERLVPPKRIDVAWHTFLLFTRDYAGFCEDHLGTFVHHAPRRLSWEEAAVLSQRTQTLATHRFGPLSQNWSVSSGSGDCPTTCED